MSRPAVHPPGPPVAAPTQAHSTGLDPCPAHRAGLSGPMQLMTQNARTAIMRPTSRPPLSSGAPPTADWGQTRLNHPLTAHTSCPHDGEDTPTHLFEQRSQTPLTWPSRTSLPTPPHSAFAASLALLSNRRHHPTWLSRTCNSTSCWCYSATSPGLRATPSHCCRRGHTTPA